MLTEAVEGEKEGFGQVVIIKWLSTVIYLENRDTNKVTKMTEVWSWTEFCVIDANLFWVWDHQAAEYHGKVMNTKPLLLIFRHL